MLELAGETCRATRLGLCWMCVGQFQPAQNEAVEGYHVGMRLSLRYTDINDVYK